MQDSHPLFAGHAAIAFDKQQHLADLVGDADWRFDLATGLLSFGDRYRWQTQLLGTESESSGTWLWAWANSASRIPSSLLVAGLVLKVFGEQHAIHELTEPEVSLDSLDGHSLALLASTLCEANAYYRCAHDGGALYVLIMDKNFPKSTDPPLQRIATVFPQVITTRDIPDHRLALTCYLGWYKLDHQADGNQVIVRENGEPALTATFDEHNRLTHLEAKPPPPPASKRTSAWDDELFRRMLGG